jgi:copper chaperone
MNPFRYNVSHEAATWNWGAGISIRAETRPGHNRQPGACSRQGMGEKERRMGEDRKVAIPIGGMTCQHCADSVTKALSGLAGVSGVSVDLRKGMATVTGNGIDSAAIKSTIEDLGFDAGVPC